MEEYKQWLEQQIERCLNDKDLQHEHWAFCKAYEKFTALRQPLVSGQSEQFGCYGCKHFNNCGIRMDYGNDGCDDKE